MRFLLAILIAMGLMMNPASGLIMAACAKASMSAPGNTQARAAGTHAKMHMHGAAMEDCHKHPSNPPANKCKGCDKNAKCTHGSCSCLKGFSAFLGVQPARSTGTGVAALLPPTDAGKPPGSARQPPPPPPQS